MTANLFFSICCLFFSLLLNAVIIFKKNYPNIETKIYKRMTIVNLICLISELVSSYLTFTLGQDSLLVILAIKGLMGLMNGWIVLQTMYIFFATSSEKTTKNFKKYEKILFIPLIVLVDLLVLLFPITFTEGLYGKGVSGPAVTIVVFESVVLSIFSVLIMIKNKGKIKKTKLIPFFLYLVLLLIATCVQQRNPGMMLTTSVETFITFMMYFTIENPDVKMIAELNSAKNSAEKANHAKSDFLSNMSHEIRTPLNAIVGFSESLKEDNIPRESREKVDDIIMASNNLLELVNGILDISKIEANKLEIIDKEYNINLMLEELIALTKARIGDKGLDFRIEIDKSLPAILYGDNVRLKQIILNVLTNAVKYTKEGFIDFKVSSIIKDDVCRLIISVEDSGIGIKEENLPKVFSKFERLNVEKQLTIEGTGLGLAITKRLVDLMHGKIIVQSIYGQGSKFTISIDQRIISLLPEPIKETKKSQSSVIDATGSKILIVDDNELNIKVAKTLLTKYHFTIDSCTSGAEALTKIKDNQSYDFILMDDMMPRMSGRQTFQELQKRPDFHIPTIILTANAIDGMRDEYLSLGFDDYLSKPINKTELERVITKFVNQKNISKTAGNHSVSTTSIIKDEFDLPKMKEILTNQQAINEVKNILIVDDNELNLKVAQTMLKHYGYNLTTCQSGRDCIAKVIENKYDLILMDEMMPGLSGCDTLKNLQDIEGFTTPVILVTAASKDEVASKITTYGFADYLSKPLNKELLNDTILKYIK